MSNILKQALHRHRPVLFAKANVLGVGIGEKVTAGRPTGKVCLKVYVEKKLPASKLSSKNLVPPKIGRVLTDVEEVGKIRAFSNTLRERPAKGGSSIGHFKITAGTLGCLVTDKKTKKKLILSNNHVLADSNRAKIGDPILQPGKYDGGKLGPDTFAKLLRFEKIQFRGKPNHVDCALAEPLKAGSVSSEIIEIGTPKGTVVAKRGMSLQKSGRTTGYTLGKVKDTDASIKVDYDGQTALFVKQILTTAMSQGGDSGSLVLNEKKQATGLLFAGSEAVTICNPIGKVLETLGVVL
jgi:S1-C subfamily serine protease